jgi:hypothetical protein
MIRFVKPAFIDFRKHGKGQIILSFPGVYSGLYIPCIDHGVGVDGMRGAK